MLYGYTERLINVTVKSESVTQKKVVSPPQHSDSISAIIQFGNEFFVAQESLPHLHWVHHSKQRMSPFDQDSMQMSLTNSLKKAGSRLTLLVKRKLPTKIRTEPI